MRTFTEKTAEIKQEWYVVDAQGLTLGRLAARIAPILKGKHKPTYTPHLDCGDFVIVVNADKVRVTGRKLDQKQYYHHSGYPGGLTTISLRHQLERHPERVLEAAVRGMLPKNRLGRRMFKKLKVYADETRPLLQGSRLTAWELQQEGIDVTLICDNMAAVLMRQGKVNHVIVGADRIARNGDTANKIGTYGLAVLANHHGIPFYVAAPMSTFDETTASGRQIIIEERGADEVTLGFGQRTAPEGVKVYAPAFDITPNELISCFITDSGIRPGGRLEAQ